MEILVSGSMAYDRIMRFGGRFSDHILPDQLDNINISLAVDSLTEHIGGTAGNIAYSLSLLGEKPRIVACMGRDYHRYFNWLETFGIGTGDIRIIEDELTAGAYITTDVDSNQFTGFNPGAMKYQAGFDYARVDPSDTLAIVGPGNLADMMEFTARNSELGIYTIFDPGQSLPIWEASALARCIEQSNLLICNEYELGMISNSTGLANDDLAVMVEHMVVTRGEDGADVYSGGAKDTVPVVPANAVDPTGAGDAFRGGLIKGLVQGVGIKRAVQMGTVCGYYVVQAEGTQTYSYPLSEYEAKLREAFGD